MDAHRITGLMALLALAAGHTAEPATPLDLLADAGAWETIGGTARSFTFLDGGLQIQQGGGEPSAIITRENYENFAIQFDFNYHQWEESGLYLHAPANGAWQAGLEIELADHAGEAPDPFRAGAVFRHVAPRVVAVKEPGAWNTCRVRMDWPHLQVTINDELVQDLDLDAHPRLKHTLRSGRIGFQNNLGWGMEIRNLLLAPLPDSAPAITMFDGKTLEGWTPVRNKRAWWTPESGVLRGKGGNGYLQYQQPCQDFSFQGYYRASSSANGGVFFRWKSDDSDRGNEVQILDVPGVGMVSGSIYGFVRGRDDLFTPGAWNLLQVFVSGGHAVTYVNGRKSAETDQLDKIWPGHITLQMHRDDATIDWKDLVLIPAD